MRSAGLLLLVLVAPVRAQDGTGRRLKLDSTADIHRLRFVDSNRLLVLAGDVIEYDWRAGGAGNHHPVPAHANPDCSHLSPDGSRIAVRDGGGIRPVKLDRGDIPPD